MSNSKIPAAKNQKREAPLDLRSPLSSPVCSRWGSPSWQMPTCFKLLGVDYLNFKVAAQQLKLASSSNNPSLQSWATSKKMEYRFGSKGRLTSPNQSSMMVTKSPGWTACRAFRLMYRLKSPKSWSRSSWLWPVLKQRSWMLLTDPGQQKLLGHWDQELAAT